MTEVRQVVNWIGGCSPLGTALRDHKDMVLAQLANCFLFLHFIWKRPKRHWSPPSPHPHRWLQLRLFPAGAPCWHTPRACKTPLLPPASSWSWHLCNTDCSVCGPGATATSIFKAPAILGSLPSLSPFHRGMKCSGRDSAAGRAWDRFSPLVLTPEPRRVTRPPPPTL